MAQMDNSIIKHVKQTNVLVIAVLLLILLIVGFAKPELMDSTFISLKLRPFIQAGGRICVFLLYAMTIVLVVNYVYYGIFKLSRRNFYEDDQRGDLIEVLRDPTARADIAVFRQKTKALTAENNTLAEIIASMLPSALKQQFMLEQYFKTKMENHMSKFSGSVNTISLIGNIGPIVGFLGTLLGLILAFAVSADAIRTEGQMTPDTFGQLQYSIMIAIITSIFGVTIKVIGSIVRQALLSKIGKIDDEITTIPIESMYSE